MVVRLRVSGSWKNVSSLKLRVSGAWKNISTAYIKVAGAWKLIYTSSLTPKIASRVDISASLNSTTSLYTLSGTNYHWTDSTGLEYQYQQSTDNGVTFYNLTSLATITNPVVSNSIPSYLVVAGDVLPNVTNIFKVVVLATNSTYNTFQTSDRTYSIEGVTDVTDFTNDAQDATSIDFSWLGGLNGSGYIYQYQTYTGGVGGGWSSQVYTLNTYLTISNLTSNTDYQLRVKGVSGSSTSNQGYSGNWAYQVGKTDAAPEPTVVSYPSISGAGVVGNSLIPTTGSYTNFISKETAILATTYNTVTQKELPISYTLKTDWSGITYFPYTITQSDATNVKYKFYTVDKVIGIGNITYYYYSSPVVSSIGTITDNFGRTVASGYSLGQSSSGYIYNGPGVISGWSVNGSVASNSVSINSATTSYGWAKQTIETGGQPDVTVKVQFPYSDAGLGVAFWVSEAGSWWAATSYKKSIVTIGISCTGTTYTGTTCPTVGVNAGDYCDCVTVTIPEIAPACTVSKTQMPTDGGSLGTAAGDRCTAASTTTYYVCNTPVTGSTSNPTIQFGPYGPSNVGNRCSTGTSSTSYACDGSVSGASSAGSLATLPYISSDVGSRCSAATANTSYACNGSVSGASSAGSLASTPYISSDVGSRCTAATASTSYSCNVSVTGASSVGSLASAPYGAGDVGVRCSSYTTNTNTTYQCGGSVSGASSAGGLVSTYNVLTLGQRCSAFTTTVTYSCNNYVTGRTSVGSLTSTYSAATVGQRCSAYTGTNPYAYYVVGSTTTYNYSTVNSTTTTTYDYTKVSSSTTYSYSTVTSSTTYSYSTVTGTTLRNYDTVGASTVYAYYVNDSGTPSSTGKSWKTQVSGNTTLYKTYLRVYSASGSSVNLENENEVASSPTAYATVWGAGVTTQGNSITASLYSNSGLTAILGSSTYLNPSSPARTDAYGSTHAGIIKGYTAEGGTATSFDNLTIIPAQ